MPSYGPWTQDPDYTTDATYSDAGRFTKLGAYDIEPTPRAFANVTVNTFDGRIYTSDGTLMALFAALQDDVPSAGEIVNSVSQATVLDRRSINTEGGDFDDFDNIGTLGVGHYPWVICDEGPDLWHPDTPDDAIGIEYLDHPEWTSDPIGNPFQLGVAPRVGATLRSTTEFHHMQQFAEVGAAYTHRLGLADINRAQAATYYNADPDTPGSTYTLASGFEVTGESGPTVTGTLGYDIDLTPYLDLELGGVLYTINDSFVPNIDNTEHNQRWLYGKYLSRIRIRQTWHPPVYRWVYDSTPPTYRRTFPRDDGLAGGARRNYPPSKATQYGNRTTGGYL